MALTPDSLIRNPALDCIATTLFERLSGATADTMSVRQVDARRHVAGAMGAMGGHGNPAGSCVWFMVGLDMPVREWAARQG